MSYRFLKNNIGPTYVLVVLSIFFIQSCVLHDSNKQNTLPFSIEFYPNGKIKELEEIAGYSDSCILTRKQFNYKTGVVKKKVNYKCNLLHGGYEEFFGNEKIKAKGKFVNGEREGRWEFYDSSQNDSHLRRLTTYLSGKKFGGELLLDENGHFRLYNFYCLDGLEGRIHFNSDTIQVTGSLNVVYCNKNDLEMEESYEELVFVGVPPGFKSKINVNLEWEYESNFEFRSEQIEKTNVFNSDRYIFHFKPDKKGLCKIHHNVKIFNEDLSTLYQDSFQTEIRVN